MGEGRGCHRSSLLHPDLASWNVLAAEVETVLGVPVEAFIEENHRYIIRTVNIGYVGQLFYLRLSFHCRFSEETGEAAWIKVDYLVFNETLRRRGLGKRVVELAKQWAWRLGGYDFLCLYSRPENAPFWRRCGFDRKESEERMSCILVREG